VIRTRGKYINIKKRQKNFYFDLLFELVRTNFKLRYNDSFLGFIWVILKPLLTFLVLFVVFSSFRASSTIPNYPIYLLLGVILYTFFNEGILLGLKSLLEKSSIILKINFPREIAVISSLSMAIINLVINLFILLLISFFSPITVTLTSGLYFLFLCATFYLLIVGISYFASIMVVRFRDLDHITQLVMQLGFYATPIFYPLEIIPEYLGSIPIRHILSYNPIYIIIQAARDAIILGEITFVSEVTIILLVSIFLTITGYLFFKARIRKIAEYF
jgi:ABC-2 type transport system permease protein